MQSFLSFIVKSVALGAIISTVILLLVPDLRSGSGLPLNFFSSGNIKTEKISFSEAVNSAAPAVVNIYSTSIDNRGSIFRPQQYERTSLGSGVIMDDAGHILTCLHVIQNAESILVGLQDGQRLEAQIIGYDPYTDLAVLKVSADNLHVIPQMETPNMQVGDVVLAIGNPYNLGQTITQGIVSRIGRDGLANYSDFIQTDAVLNEGNSGGALVDSNGYLIGINNSNFKTWDERRRVKDVNGVFFAVPYEQAKRSMDEIITTGKVTRGQLGLTGTEMGTGILINSVAPGSPADTAGVQINDILLSIDGIRSDSVIKTLDFIAETTPGTQINLEISRNNAVINLPVIVGELGG